MIVLSDIGSSPRVWGQVGLDIWYQFDSRIIPTRVGTSRACIAEVITQGDHPHACGDKTRPLKKLPKRWGSSPRVWGQVEYTGERHAGGGIIPTRVGTSCIIFYIENIWWDHPHACGDKSYNYNPYPHIQGSSPRVWGQECKSAATRSLARIIPTRVGTRQNGHTVFTKARDHPHACGDKVKSIHGHYNSAGSSPRVWGQD